MSRADRWLERLNFSTRARHAMVQAVLDWRHELQASSTIWQTLRVHALGACGVARLLAHEAISSTAEAFRPGWIVRVLATCAVVTVVLSLPRIPFATIPRLFSITPGFHPEDARFTSEVLIQLAVSALSSVWIALFICIVARKSGPPVPLIGVTAGGIVIMTLLATVGWS